MEGCCEILNVRNGVAIRYGTIVQCTVVTTGSPVSQSLLRDHVYG